MRATRRWAVLVGLLVVLAAPGARAHSVGVSRSEWLVRPAEGLLEITFGLHESDLEGAVDVYTSPLPADLGARAAEIKKRLLEGLAAAVPVTADGRACAAQPMEIARREGVELRIRWACPAPFGRLVVRLEWLRQTAPGHRHLAHIRSPAGDETKVLGRSQVTWAHAFPVAAPGAPPSPPVEPAAAADDTWEVFGQLVVVGIEHIALGWDHLLFLLALLALGGNLAYLLRIVTSFTVAHSITLGLAYSGLVAVSPAVVEAVIAASIVFVALENLWIREGRWRWIETFGFGLVHGFGFAGALSGLELGQDRLAVTLFGFNVGVEVGQIVAVAAVWPLLAWAARHGWYRARVLRPLSVLAAAGGLVALLDRTVGLL